MGWGIAVHNLISALKRQWQGDFCEFAASLVVELSMKIIIHMLFRKTVIICKMQLNFIYIGNSMTNKSTY